MVEIDAFTGHNGVADRYAIALAGWQAVLVWARSI
jgi:hypothetical protein